MTTNPDNGLVRAIDDIASTQKNTKIGIRILENDLDADGNSLKLDLESFTQGSNGRVVRNNNGTKGHLCDDRLVYIPNEGSLVLILLLTKLAMVKVVLILRKLR